MRVRLALLASGLITLGLGVWMLSGEKVIGGTEDPEAPLIPPAQRAALQEKAVLPRVVVEEMRAVLRRPVLEISGRTQAQARVLVRAETTARVLERPVEVGSRVQVGDPLCLLEEGARSARLLEAQAKLAQAELDYAGAKRLSTQGFTAQTRVASLKAAVDTAQAHLLEAQLEQARSVVRAPISGIVENPLAEIGDVLSVGDACATVINPDPMRVIVQIHESKVGAVSVGQKVSIKLMTGDMQTGILRSIASAADPETRTFRGEISFKNPGGKIRDGLTAVALISLSPQKAYKISPAVLTLNAEGRVGIQTLTKGDVSRFVPVTLIESEKEGIWIEAPYDSLRVVTIGQDYISEGQHVHAEFDPSKGGRLSKNSGRIGTGYEGSGK